jgi:hypothetical protein
LPRDMERFFLMKGWIADGLNEGLIFQKEQNHKI